MVCAGLSLAKLEDYVMRTDLRRFGGKKSSLLSFAIFHWPFAMHKSSGLPGIIRECLGKDPKLGELTIPFATTGIDLVSNGFVIYASTTHGDMLLSEAVEIATALPFVYPPYQVGGRIVVDAAVATTCPVWLTALQDNSLPIIALTCAEARDVERPRNLAEFIARIIGAGVDSGDEYLLSLMRRVGRIEIRSPKVQSRDFGISDEVKRALLDAGKRAIDEAQLDNLGSPAFQAPSPVSDETGGVNPGDLSSANVINIFYEKEVNMSHNINVGGSANINIDSVLTNVNQTIGQTDSLAPNKKDELKELVATFQKELDSIKQSHAAETAMIAQRLQEIVNGATQPPEKRNKKLLEISGKGLMDAAETVEKIVPGLLTTARLIGQFVLGLP